MQQHPVYRVLSVTRLVGQIYAGYKVIQLLGKVTSAEYADEQLRRHHRRCAELIYETAAQLQGEVEVHADSTAKLDLLADWRETRDDVTKDSWEIVTARAHVMEIPTHLDKQPILLSEGEEEDEEGAAG